MSDSLELEDGEKSPWIWKAAIVALPLGLALSAAVAMYLKVTTAEKTGMEAVSYSASDFKVEDLRDSVSKIETLMARRDFESEEGQEEMLRMISFISGSLASINLGYRVENDRGEAKGDRIWKNYWIDSEKATGDDEVLVWTTYSGSQDSASVAALLSLAEWIRGRTFERRIRIAFLWSGDGLPQMMKNLKQNKEQILIEVSGLGQGSYGLTKIKGTPENGTQSESYFFTAEGSEQTATDWKMTLAWETYLQQVRSLCEEVSQLAGESTIYKP